jgi:hypothetical protein
VDYESVVESSPLVIDTRGFFKERSAALVRA